MIRRSLLTSALTLAVACSSGGSSSSGTTVQALTVNQGSLRTVNPNQSFSIQIDFSGGIGPYTFSVTNGSLPPGVTLDNNGLLSGTPSTPGRFNFTIEVRDSRNNTTTQTFNFVVAPDLVTYLGDVSSDTIDEMRLVDISSSTPGIEQNLNGPLVANGEVDSNPVTQELFSPDGSGIVFVADKDTDGLLELYYVDVVTGTATTPVKISGTQANTGVTDIRWAPDSSSLLYRSDANSPGQFELFLVRFNGATPAAPVRISGTLTAGGSVNDLVSVGRGQGFDYSPNSQLVVYQADQDVAGELEIYVVDISGTPTAPVQINTSLPTGGTIDFFGFSNTSTALVYSGEQQTLGIRELFYVTFNGSTPQMPIQVNATITTGGSVKNDGQLVRFELFSSDSGFGFAPDDSGIAFLAETGAATSSELFYVPITSQGLGTPVRVNSNLVDTSADVNSFIFTPDGQSIIYNADQDSSGTDELYLARLSNGAVASITKLNQSIDSNRDVRTFINGNGYSVSASGQYVMFLVDADIDNVNELFIVDISGTPTTPVKVNADIPLANTSADINNAQFARLSDTLIYVGDQDTEGVDELYLYNIAQATRTKLSNPTTDTNFDVQISFAGAQFAPSEQRVIYRKDDTVNSAFNIFAVDISTTTPGSPVQLNTALVSGGRVANFALSKR